MAESQIEQVLVTAINHTLCDKDSFLATLQNNIETVLSQGNSHALADIDKRLKELQTELLKLATSNADYEKVGNEIYRSFRKAPMSAIRFFSSSRPKFSSISFCFLSRNRYAAIAEYDESLVRRLVEKVTVYEGKYTVKFKSGVTVDVEE